MSTIAIVEDEPKLASVLRDYLEQANYKTVSFDDGAIALAELTASPVDLILLDIMLPGVDGMTICKEIRKHSAVPIIMLTARVEEIDRLLGLELGADDYICKPYSPREVVARVKAVLRRTSVTIEDAAGNNDFNVNENNATVKIREQECSLTAVELGLLLALSNNPGRIFNRDQLMRRIYPDDRIVSDRTIDSHVKKLRQKLEQLAPGEEYIHSVYGIGYKFEQPEPGN